MGLRCEAGRFADTDGWMDGKRFVGWTSRHNGRAELHLGVGGVGLLWVVAPVSIGDIPVPIHHVYLSPRRVSAVLSVQTPRTSPQKLAMLGHLDLCTHSHTNSKSRRFSIWRFKKRM
jgi:hypothetical protein